MKKYALACLTFAFPALSSAAQSFDLVCDGHLTEKGLSEFIAQSIPPNALGVLIQFDGQKFTVSGREELAGNYDTVEEDAASFKFGNKQMRTGGNLNRYSGKILMMKCADEECEAPEFVFQGDCSKRQRKF